MLKKQTVWLLTMLSLMIVLSVYYLTSPDGDEIAYVNKGQDESEEATANEDAGAEEGASVEDIVNEGQNELFTTIRMELQDERSEAKERLNEVVASSTASAEEKNQAYEDIAAIENRSTKETILEESILASAESKYQDVLVRWDEGKVFVHVNTKELSKTEANNIMQLVRDEFGEIPVHVDFEHSES
ncbi:SpoIIIAH-like family protein [Virgibacillus ndiopensis]|uniref:SpoIIIAH-like family protein n=1 Tax=Virgibacillus ndiopensis TaxID=2004408 RepID=UPI000C07E425|nr:SpoIIIAH-like family protein [Virgibacillus ndiopensis]